MEGCGYRQTVSRHLRRSAHQQPASRRTMTYLVDSDWVADYLKGRQQAVQLLDSLFRDGMAISIITFAEIYEGIYYGSDPKRNEEIFAHFLQGVDVLGINRPVAGRF